MDLEHRLYRMALGQREKSSGSKQKRVKDVTQPNSPRIVAGSAEPVWDKTTFRVSQIPERLGPEDLSQVLVQMFCVTVTNFSIHSLALAASDETDPPWKTATVSFRVIPARLKLAPDLAGDWDFELPRIAAAEFGHRRICFDTHFNGFTPLSPADHISRPIDCVVIPGWGGHALGSFRSPTSSYVWLRDSLPRHCPELRVWTYGYPSYLTNENSSADLYEYADRFKKGLRILRQQTKAAGEVKPLIFIAHSLGGWIFKDAMIQMKNSSDEVDQETVLSTYGALFFGVPTQGMDVEAIANMVQNLPARYISTLLDQKDGFRLRQRQHQDFCQAFDYKDSRIVQFFELEKSPTVIQDPKTKKWSRSGPLALLVSPASATQGRAWETGSEYTFSLAGNHSDMIKFPNDRNDYPIVRSCLQQFTKQAAMVVGNRCKKFSNELKPSKSNDFTDEQKDCLQSLSFPEMHERRNGIDDPASGTCVWLSKHPTYLKWFNQQHGMLWIKGKPGAGKSTLIKHVVCGLEDFRGGDAVLASFFFHGRGALIQKTTAGLFRSLLHQLLQQLPELLKEFSGLHKARIEREGQYGKWEWHERELQNFFKTRVPKAAKKRTVRLYIDALDEAGEATATEILEYFEIFSSSLAVCFSCRHYPLLNLENGLEVFVEDGNGRDIDTYIDINIDARLFSAEIVHPIREDIAAKSSGSFQWVTLVIRLILRLYKDGNSLVVLRSKIKQLPSKLSDIYKELLESVDEEDLHESLILMRWVLLSFRPLKLSELRFALVMGQENSRTSIRECQSSSWFSTSDEDLKRKVLALSKGLVDVRELQDPCKDYGFSSDDAYYDDASNDDSSYHGASNDDDSVSRTLTEAVSEPFSKRRLVEAVGGNVVVQFIHQSVKDFLLEGGLQMLEKSHLNDMVGRGHFCLSRSCIRYLTMENVRHLRFEDYSYRNNHTVLPLLDYAAQFWHVHSKEVEKRDPALAGLLSMIWRSSDTLTQIWIKVSWMLNVAHGPDFPEAHWSLLHVASRLNLPSVISAMPDQGSVANMKVRGGRTPLSIATRAGSNEVVRMLLDRDDVEPNSVDDHGRTPFFHAAHSGRKSTLLLLLNRENIDMSLKDANHVSPLYWAFKYFDEDIVEILLQRTTVDVDCLGFLSEPPLCLATIFGWEAIIKSLLHRKEIDPNAKDYRGYTPLSYAAQKGNEAVVKMLLHRKEIDPNAKDYKGNTPLSYSAQNDNEAIIKMLLERTDIDPEAKDSIGYTPLSYATQNDNEAIVKMLLDRTDIDPEAKDSIGCTPLSYAAQNDNEAITKILLNRKEIDPNVKDHRGYTPLSYAAQKGNEAVVKMLLNRTDIDPNAKDIFQSSPLSIATYFHHEGVVKLLLDRKDVDVNIQDDRGLTPLHRATLARRGLIPPHSATIAWKSIAKLLLDRKDVNPSIKDYNGRILLSRAASSHLYTSTVQLLLARKDVDVNIQDDRGLTPLHRATLARRGLTPPHSATITWKSIAKLLLDRKDVNPSIKDYDGRTLLSRAASSHLYTSTVQLLLARKDVDVNTQDCDGRTPLTYAAINGHNATVQLLLNRKEIDANTGDCSGRTPLSYAVQAGKKTTVQLLLDRSDVDPNVPNNNGVTPLDYATRQGYVGIAKMLRDRTRVAGSSGS